MFAVGDPLPWTTTPWRSRSITSMDDRIRGTEEASKAGADEEYYQEIYG
jgi:hypothetical protein